MTLPPQLEKPGPTGRGTRHMAKQVGVRTGVEKDLHPHTLRHTFAPDLDRNTKNLPLTQVALGHRSITTPAIHTHVAPVEREAAMQGLKD